MNYNESLSKGKAHTYSSGIEPDTVDIYMEKPKTNKAINADASIFNSKMQKGINTYDNVFDRVAVFKHDK